MYRILLLAAAIISVCGVILASTKGNQTSPLPKLPLNHEDKGMMAKILFEQRWIMYSHPSGPVQPLMRTLIGELPSESLT